MFYKDYPPVVRHDNLCTECIGERLIFFTSNQRCPSQTPDELENYCQNCYLTLSNTDDRSPFCSIVIENFNARCRNWQTGKLSKFKSW